MESNGVVGAVPPHSATPESPLHGYQEPGKLSHKCCPWSCSEGCSEPAGIHTGCPFLPAPQCARDAPCHPKDTRLLPPLPKNGQPKGWAEPPKERPRWAEAVLGPLALYSHGYHRYPVPFPVESKPHSGTDGDPKTFRHCPFLLSSALPAEPRFGGTEGVTGSDWHLGSYVPTWGQPLYLGVPPRGKAAPTPFSDCSGSGNRDFYPRKDPTSQPQDSAPPQLLEGRNGDGEGAPPGPPWRDGRAVPPPHALTPPPNAAPHPGAVRSCGAPWVGAQPRSAHRPAPGEERPMGGGGPDPTTAGRCPAALPCPVGGCGAMGPFDTAGSDGETPAGGRGGVQKLKKTWLTRHSEQSGPRCRAARRDGTEEGFKRAGKRPSGHQDGSGAGAAKRGFNGTGRPGGTGTERGQGGKGGKGGTAASPDPRSPPSVPCTALPESIPRCCACAARGAGGEDEDGEPPESACRMLHFRRLAFGDGGTLSVDGFCTVDEAEGEIWGAGGGTEGRSVCTAKYLLSVLGGPFCTAVLKDRDAWPGAHGGVTAWRCREGPPRLCDLCHRRFFNRHWSCARCGFQLCAECRRGRGEEDGHALSQLWQQLHEVCSKFSIASRCPCGDGGTEGTAEPQEKMEGADPPDPPDPNRELSSAAPIEAERREGGSPVPPPRPPRGAVQTATLCDLLASTAVRLCPGHPGVRMAFAPVASALHSDNRLTAILDSIIARVVERKIQERHGGTPRPSPPPGTPTSHRVLTPGGLLWLQDPPHATSYALFQQHWRQGQPVLVSGLQQRLDGGLWGPESFRPPGGGQQEVEVTELRAQKRVRMGSRRFWDGFIASAACPTLHPGAAELLKLECSFGDAQPYRATNPSCALPLPEYCAPHGRLNLTSHLHGRQGCRWLQPRICASYGIPPQDDAVGTKTLSVEAVDSISVALHAAPGAPLQRDTEDVAEELTERLRAAGCRPAALWHVFRPEDAACIRDFLHGAAGGAAPQPPAPYLHAELRRRLREERGVSCHALLQCVGDAVLLPAGAPYQVRSLAATISMQQSFLSPESAARIGDGAAAARGEMQWLQGQVDGMVVAAVRQAVAVLRGCK
ncbi:lysine-specific demethylase hairless [Phasianus colchicus]|uniref:lysine-specific demethylase hairless n=1 Tax=Phasianus colchicus TaxID=9054 RepID=UPI00129DC548|nr:lysine-specific demethylase hairless [Phasianus colchicus]